jgi:hypothetical protein
MKTKILFALILIVSTYSGCKKIDDPVESRDLRIIIDHYQRTGFSEGKRLVYAAQTGSDIGTSKWGDLFDYIDGFNYEPGFIYDITVNVKTVHNITGGTTTTTSLRKINSSLKVADNTTFEVYMKLNKIMFITGDAIVGYKILDKIKIDCGAVCDDLKTTILNGRDFIGKFAHNSDGSYLLKEIVLI